MKNIFIIILFSLFFSNYANSSEPVDWRDIIINNTSEDCGVKNTADNSSGLIINPNDASICSEDISMNILYFIFGKVIEEIAILQEITNVSDGVKEVSIGLGVGDPIISVLSTVSALVVMVGLLIGIATIVLGIFYSTENGFMGKDWKSKQVPGRVAVGVISMMPIFSGLSLIQVSVIVVAVFSNILGNFVLANFLNLVQVKSTTIDSSPKITETMSISQSGDLIMGELCLTRTSQKLLEDRWITIGKDYEDNSILNDDNWFGIGFGKKDLTVKESLERYDNCMTPTNIYEIENKGGWFSNNDNRNKYINYYSRGNISQCRDNKFAYNEESYGSPYNCSYVKYKYSDLATHLKGPNSNEDEAKDLILNAVESFRASFSDRTEYNQVKKLEENIKNIFEEESNVDFSNEKLKEKYIPIVASLKEKIKTNIENEIKKDSDISSDLDLKYNTVFIYHQYVLNNLMGAYYRENETDRRGRGGSEISTNRNKSEDISSFAEEIIFDFAKPAADYLEKSHCAEFWSDVKNSRDTVRRIKDSMDIKSENLENISMECLKIISPENSSTGDYEVVFNTIENEFINADENPEFSGNKAFKDKAIEFHKSKIAPEAENLSKIKHYTLALWYFVAREAVLASISEINKESTDEIVPTQIRKQGWAGLGGYILQISGNQQNANKMYNQIMENIEWGGEYTTDASDFVNKKAFKNSGDNQEDVNENYEQTFENMNWNSFLSSTTKRIINQSGVTESIEDESMDIDILEDLEDMLTYPMDYLEKASGIENNDRSLREAIKECSSNGTCKISDVHPLNALMQFGHELVTLSTTLLITEVVASSIANMSNDNPNSGVIKNKLKSVVTKIPFITAITGIASFVTTILEVLYPLTVTLLFVGVLFAYIVPTLPYVAFTIVFINWIVLVVELCISMPIWLIFFVLTNKDGTAKTDVKMLWNFYGQLLLKPAFVVISLIVGWSISSISLYIINMTLFSSSIGSSLNGSVFTGIIDLIMFYVIYIIIVFVLLRQSFSVINNLTDTMFQRINIQSTGDSNMIQQLDLEKVLQTAAITNVIENLSKNVKDQVRDISSGIKLEEENKRMQLEIEKIKRENEHLKNNK